MDSALLQILIAGVSGGFLTKVFEVAVSNWKEVSGRKKTSEQRVRSLQAALARNTYLAIKAGVPIKELEKDPEET